MYCMKCGTQLPSDSQFCTNCGARVDGESTPTVGPIAPPPMGQPYADGQRSPKKKSKTLFWILIGIAAALVAAAVLFFAVFSPVGNGGPFSGNTLQTRFANDAVGVFTGAFDGLNTNSKTNQLMDKPFDVTMKVSTEVSGIKSIMDMNAAYDEEVLGMGITSSSDYSNSDFAEFFADSEAMESTIKILLLEDILYTEQDGTVEGLKFDSDADLSKAMTLKKRIAALLETSDSSSIDTIKLIEMFLNSIDEERFEKSTGKITLTLDAQALADTLDLFAEKLSDDDELNDALSNIIKDATGYAYDISDMISLAAPMLSQSEFEFIWTVEYDGANPVSNEISFEQDGSMVFEAVIAFENKGDDRKIDVDLTAAGETGTLDLLIKKTAKGLEFEGAIHIPGSDDVTITGWQETAGDDISGSFKLSSPSADVMSIDYEGTIFIGKPKEAVKDDSRFEVDTDDAAVIDFEDSLEENFSQDFTGIPSLGMGN